MNRSEWYDRTAQVIIDRLDSFYQTFYPDSTLEKLGKGYRLQPCPMCGHNDCCTIGDAVNCFSGACEWRGTHINAWIQYAQDKLRIGFSEALERLEQFTGIPFPVKGEEMEEYKKRQTQQRILIEAEKFYHRKLMETKLKYDYKGKSMNPLEYLTVVRKRKIQTINEYSVGFVKDYQELHSYLISMGFQKEDIKNSHVWAYDGLFIFFYRHHTTKDIVRFNTKNPFNIKRKGEDGVERTVQGYSYGNKSPLFSNGFSFKNPITIVEGEHDLFSVIENGGTNVACIGGNPSEDEWRIFEKAENIIYSATDNDEAGAKYLKILNGLLPHKDLRKVNFPEKYNDVDEYYREQEYGSKHWDQLCEEAERIPVSDSDRKIYHEDNVWTIANRVRKLEFKIERKDNKGNLIGTVNYYVNGVVSDRSIDATLSKCKAKMKPFNFDLADAIDEYFNLNLENRTVDELIDIYWYSSHKASIIKILAIELAKDINNEELIQKLKIKLKAQDGSDNIFDAILKEVNDIQNRSANISYSDIPRVRISQYFNVKNNDAYFYYINVKSDGDAIRQLPYLLRNDGQSIRLDLLKRKDSQCLLLIDNKYELPQEVNEVVMNLKEVSLTKEWAEKFAAGEVSDDEISPIALVKKIEWYLRKFYYTRDQDTYKMIAIWIYATYYYELFAQIPYLYVNGIKGSGKTALDGAIYLMAFNTRIAVDITEASLYRMLSFEGGTIILDEMESLTSRKLGMNSTMASALKSGYKKAGYIFRSNKKNGSDDLKVDGYDSYGPKVISNIFGLDDVIEDRCIPIFTHRMPISPNVKIEDVKMYEAERMSEMRELTSKCCLSALKNFVKLRQIFANNKFMTTSNARLSEILTPVIAVAKFVDIPEKEFMLEDNPGKDIFEIEGEYEAALVSYYNRVIKPHKKEIDANTPEGVLKKVVEDIAKELWGNIPYNQREYTNTDNHKYQEEIRFNKEEGWFEINVLHFKCFVEENMPGDVAYPRIIPRWVKTCWNFGKTDITRKTVKIDDEDLMREFKNNARPKVNTYRFYFRNFIDIGKEEIPKGKPEEVNLEEARKAMKDKLF